MAETGYERPGNIASASTTRAEEPKRGAMVTDRVEVKKAANGGFIATCYKKPASEGKGGLDTYVPPKDYAFSSLSEAQAFMAQEFGEGGQAPEAKPDAPPAPNQAPPAPAAPPMMGGDGMPPRPRNTSVY